jgi:peptide/nickel transport system permease protein
MSFLAKAVLLLLCLASILADFLSTNAPNAQNLNRYNAPPSRIHLFDFRGDFHWRPFVYDIELVDPLDTIYAEQTGTAYPIRFFTEGYGYRLLGFIPCNRHLLGCRSDRIFYPMGTDGLGRDVWARVLSGARTSLIVVLVGIFFYTTIGITIGSVAGFLGGWADAILMRFSEFVLALPALYIILALRAVLPPDMHFWQTLLLIVGTIAAVTWPPMARGVRGLILQLRNAPYVEAARSIGCSRWQVFANHMFPPLVPFALAQAAVAAPLFLLSEVILSFLNVGMSDENESWGSMLKSLQDPRTLTDYWWNLAPLAFVFVTLYCLNVLSSRRSYKDQTRIVM